jgi:hypothetical protein
VRLPRWAFHFAQKELEIVVEQPVSPDIRIGKIFDRNWELLSFLVPMPLVKGWIAKHFQMKIADVKFKNLSRLAFQWEEVVSGALAQLEKEVIGRMDNLISTVEHILDSVQEEAPSIHKNLGEIEQILGSLRFGTH